MSEHAAKARQPIDVEEFERRLRAPEPMAHDESDPLAELARLVASPGDAQGASPNMRPRAPVAPAPEPFEAEALSEFRRMERQAIQPEGVSAPAAAAPPAGDDWESDLRNWEQELRGLVGGGEPPPVAARPPERAPPVANDHHVDDVEAALHQEPFMPRADDFAFELEDIPPPRDLDAERPRWRAEVSREPGSLDEAFDPEDAPRAFTRAGAASDNPTPKSRKPLIWMGGVALGVVGAVSVGLAMRGGVIGKREAPTILAASGPAKVQPDAQASANDSSPATSVFDRGGDRIGASRVVNNEEQPVDLGARARPPAVAGANGGQQAPVAAAPDAPAPTNNFFPEPKKVKTVSVRPDGSIIEGDPTPARPVAPIPPIRPTTPSAPPVAAPAKPTAPTPKSTARIQTTPRVDGDGGDGGEGAQARPRPVTPKPATPAVAGGGGGGFVVQFAAAGSDAEARERIAKVQSQFGAALSGHKPGVVRGEANGKTVYRVRVGGLTKESAAAMCEKVKASGGSCFVAGG